MSTEIQKNTSSIEAHRENCQNFLALLNREPNSNSIDKTPDGKASTILISHIEMTLDEYFFGLWETDNFKWSLIANEIVGSIDLIVYHPSTGIKLKRVGAAAIQIMVDKVPDDIKDNQKLKNEWALNPDNKKSNALDMAFPKLKAECLKNAANSLGKLFGRDLNRKKSDTFSPLIRRTSPQDQEQTRIINAIKNVDTTEKLDRLKYELESNMVDLTNEIKTLLLNKENELSHAATV